MLIQNGSGDSLPSHPIRHKTTPYRSPASEGNSYGSMPTVSAVVVAGGKSERLGQDKSLIRLGNERLLKRVISTLQGLSDDVLLAANDRDKFQDLSVRVVPDLWPQAGPLGGIHSGLRSMRYERGIFVACDMPFLNPALLRYMILLSPGFDVVIPRIGCNVEPLHAIYSKACAQPIADLLEQHGRRVVGFLTDVRVRYVHEAEINAFDPEHISFFNINTTQDLAEARRLLKISKESARGKRPKVKLH